ncbi:low specificity L-threonine aldolase [Luteipulveratus sp. YIM 133132]|uniref:threonine aldolase family protein n=1 Tax=Luteipulveratus flavus TaxID=3031728 RepID=UPI0023B1EFA2|nr:low specificity L-threonine aldolase [Luteipulveratus sp. YIM 133132]MDE9367302.1 low specificity L-threonine aldolase [Luteipulveratus sp. YIM 133132]
MTDELNPLHDPSDRGFASDNYSGIHPEVLAAIVRANGGHQVAYGDDVYTADLQRVFREHFGEQAEAFPVFNGTGANVVALQAATARWEAVVCTTTAHIHVDEGGAPEHVAGLKLHTVDTPDGKLTPALLGTLPQERDGDEHFAQPRVVSITQTTELGTAYTAEEIRAIAEYAHERGWVLHVDGSRLSNAAASLGLPFRAFTTDVGVDILSFGGTKNGLMVGEAVVVLNPDAVRGVKFLRKTSMQLASKMRFISAQLIALLTDDLYLRNAEHANAMARRLAAAVDGVPGLSIARPVQANSVFPVLPVEVSKRLMEKFRFYFWDESTGEVRWMCGFDTTEADVDAFAAAVRAELGGV